MTSYLVDVNAWIALVYGRHTHHDVVRRWFDELPDESALFCRLTQLAFLRLLTNRQVMGVDTVSQQEAWELYDQTLSDSRVGYISEPPNVEGMLRKLTQGTKPASAAWSDAYLAAVAAAAECTVATLDHGFPSMRGIRVEYLLPV